MSLQHIVWLKKKNQCSEKKMQKLLDEVSDLAHLITDITSIYCGKNITDRSNGFTHGIIVTLTDKRSLQRYISHPAHVAVGAKLAQNADILAMDYET